MENIKLRHVLAAVLATVVLHLLGLTKEWALAGGGVTFFGLALYDVLRRISDIKELALKTPSKPGIPN